MKRYEINPVDEFKEYSKKRAQSHLAIALMKDLLDEPGYYLDDNAWDYALTQLENLEKTIAEKEEDVKEEHSEWFYEHLNAFYPLLDEKTRTEIDEKIKESLAEYIKERDLF